MTELESAAEAAARRAQAAEEHLAHFEATAAQREIENQTLRHHIENARADAHGLRQQVENDGTSRAVLLHENEMLRASLSAVTASEPSGEVAVEGTSPSELQAPVTDEIAATGEHDAEPRMDTDQRLDTDASS